jgi:two-component system chemotaxis sensor kinase CheA
VSEPELPKQLVARFRAVSLERIERVEAAWLALTQRMGSEEVEAELLQDVHTMKGEARVVGFADVVLITQRLEDLLFAARRHHYRVHEDVDVVVTMGLQFIRMLLRKKAGTSQGGIDMNGFLKHIDEVMAEWPRHSELPTSDRHSTGAPSGELARIGNQARMRLGEAATDIYLASLSSPGDVRLERAWKTLSAELVELGAAPIMPLVRRHAASARELAVELGKELDVTISSSDVRVAVEVVDALNASLLHTIRNAVDHGIEAPDVRKARGKSRRGSIEVDVASRDDAIEVTIRDDGGGVDVERVRARAASLGLVTAEEAAALPTSRLLDLVFAPGVTVRDSADAISGRGIGLDAVRAAIERVRGSIRIASNDGAGVEVTIRLPPSGKVIEVHRVPSSRSGIVVALPTTWTLRTAEGDTAVDPLQVLAVPHGKGPRVRYMLARDQEEHAFWAGGPATRATAIRICPTAPSSPVEVVDIEGSLALFLRPDVVFAAPRA